MRVLAVDYGKKRCGVAVTDVLKIAANSLPVVPTAQLLPFLIDYCGREPVERIIVGEPRTVRGEESDSMRYIRPFLGQLRKALPIWKYRSRWSTSGLHRSLPTAR